MSKEYLSNPEPKKNPDQQPPKRDNRVVILLSVILVVLLAIVTFIIVVSLKSKNGNENNPSGTPTVAESEREFSHGTKEFPQAGGEFPSGGNTSASSDAQSSATAAPNAQQSQTLATVFQNVPDRPPYSNPTAGDVLPEPLGPQKPTTVQGVLDLYNKSINKVISEKAGYTKKRTTTINTLDGGALLKIQIVADMVYDFIGEGTTEYKNEKRKAEFLSKASLTKNDISGIEIQDDGGYWVIRMSLKRGQSYADASGANDTTSLQRSGLYVGVGDKKAFDYKNAENIYMAINGVAKASSVKEQVTTADITAKIEPTTGKLVELTIKWDWNVQLTDVSYSIATVESVKGTATSTVVVNNFQW